MQGSAHLQPLFGISQIHEQPMASTGRSKKASGAGSTERVARQEKRSRTVLQVDEFPVQSLNEAVRLGSIPEVRKQVNLHFPAVIRHLINHKKVKYDLTSAYDIAMIGQVYKSSDFPGHAYLEQRTWLRERLKERTDTKHGYRLKPDTYRQIAEQIFQLEKEKQYYIDALRTAQLKEKQQKTVYKYIFRKYRAYFKDLKPKEKETDAPIDTLRRTLVQRTGKDTCLLPRGQTVLKLP